MLSMLSQKQFIKVEGEVAAKLEIAKNIDNDLTAYNNKQHLGVDKWVNNEALKGKEISIITNHCRPHFFHL